MNNVRFLPGLSHICTLCLPVGQTGSGHVLGSCLHPCSCKTPPHSGSVLGKIAMPPEFLIWVLWKEAYCKVMTV